MTNEEIIVQELRAMARGEDLYLFFPRHPSQRMQLIWALAADIIEKAIQEKHPKQGGFV